MLKTSIECTFYITHEKSSSNTPICLNQDVKCGSFSLEDSLTCGQGCTLCQPDNRETIKFTSLGNVYIVSMTEVVSHLKDKSENCDYILADEERFLLLELTCSKLGYVNPAGFKEGKKSKSRRQLTKSASLLLADVTLQQFILKRERRYLVFSWRDTSGRSDPGDKVETCMQDFIQHTDTLYSSEEYSEIKISTPYPKYQDVVFRLKEFRYPDVLDWDNLG